MENKFVRWVFKNLPAFYLGAALVSGAMLILTSGKTVRDDSFNGLAIVMGAVLLEALMLAVYKLTENKSKLFLRGICFALYGLIGLGLIVSVIFMKQELMSDLVNFHHAAENFIETGEWSRFSYFSHYPFQKGWLSVILLLYKIENALGIEDLRTLPLALDAVMLFFSAVFSAKIAEKLINLRASVTVLLLFAVNPIYYILASCYYTFIPGLFFTLLVIFLSLYENPFLSVLMGFCAAVGYEMRATVLIAFVAVILYRLFKHEKGFWKVILLSVLGFIVAYLIFGKIIDSMNFESTTISYAFTHWLVIGTTGTGSFNADVVKFDAKFETSHDMIVGDLKYIADFYNKKGASYGFWLWNHKLSKLLGEATPNIVISNSTSTDKNILWRYLSGNEKLFAEYLCQILRLVTLFNAIIAVVKVIRNRMDKIYPVFIFMFGYLLFYTFWECTPRYFLPALPVFGILSVYGMSALSEKTQVLFESKKGTKLKVRSVCAVLLAVCLVSFEGVIAANLGGLTEETEKTYVAASDKFDVKHNNNEKAELLENSPVTQSFTAYRDFDEIELKFDTEGSDDKNTYLFELLDERGNVIREKAFKNENISDNILNISLDAVTVEKSEKYTIRVSVGEKFGKCISAFGNNITGGNRRVYFGGKAGGEGYNFNQIYFVAKRIVTEPYYPKAFVFAVMAAVLLFGLVPIINLAFRFKNGAVGENT